MDRYNNMSPALTCEKIRISEMEERLEEEFLDPYVIDNAEKSE